VTFYCWKAKTGESVGSIQKIALLVCHLPIEGTSHPKLAVVPIGLPCFICGEKKNAANYCVTIANVVGIWYA